MIAGAGPVGTVMATLLARAGIDVIVLEAGEDCAQDMRASTFHPPTLEMLDEIGITPMLLERGLKAPVYHWRDRRSGEVIEFDLTEIGDRTRYPFRIQCEQYHLSRALASGLEQYPNASVRFGHRLLSFEQDEQGVSIAAETPFSVAHFRADWLIGADGANSLVRKWLGTEFDGFTYPEKFLCLSTATELGDYLPGLAHVNYVFDPDRAEGAMQRLETGEGKAGRGESRPRLDQRQGDPRLDPQHPAITGKQPGQIGAVMARERH